eukprot:3599664-Prymnesium_polylepis.1
MMHYNMLMDLCLYNEDVVFFTNDNNQLQQHPFTFPVLSLQSLILELGVTLDDYMASLLKREQDETHDDLQCKKKIIVRAIIGADTLGLGSWDGDLYDIFAAKAPDKLPTIPPNTKDANIPLTNPAKPACILSPT